MQLEACKFVNNNKMITRNVDNANKTIIFRNNNRKNKVIIKITLTEDK